MRTTSLRCNRNKQNGIALLILIISIALTISIYYFSKVSIVEIKADKQQATRIALVKAKKLLLGYAASRADLAPPAVLSTQLGRYGYLPCPAINNGEGNSVGNCGSKNENTFGWLPWRSLGSSPLKDGNSDCLLYVASGSYKHSPSPDMLNEDTNGMFQIVNEAGITNQGVAAPERVVAIVFSPGNTLMGQNRNFENGSICGNDETNYDTAYLDTYEVAPGVFIDNSGVVTGNADEIYQFVQASITSNADIFNDQFITITREELWKEILTRSDFDEKMTNLTEALAVCLNKYAIDNGNSRLPWPAPMNLPDYRLDDNYDDNEDSVAGHAGRFPYIVKSSNTDIGYVIDDELFLAANCDNLILPTGGITAHLLDSSPGSNDEYKNLWENWKDHFFYVVSQDYSPANSNAACAGNCIKVNGATSIRAATVIFSGSRDGQVRTGPVSTDINTKDLISNYIENGNEAKFPDLSGNEEYVVGGNDIMFCIEDGLGVVPC